ncbi:ABC transporter permease [Synechococcus sp. R55.6]|uniref:ABC transporter permease n=1 Tax=unclassified Synechococcus TaxID=2626047 RepID=UPI0039C22716
MSYLLSHPGLVWQLTQEHLAMVGMTLGMAVVLALPLALLIHQVRWLALPVMGILSILYTVPSLALIILLVPWFGLNARSVVVAMVIYTQVILVRHFCVGLRSVEPAILEAAKGMGMNFWQRWWQVQVPLMLPIVLAGLRLAAIVAIAIATVGAKFGAGGLGTLLFDGIAQAGRYDKIWAGSLAVGSLALLVNTALLSLEWAARRG